MARVASLFLPELPIERLRRAERKQPRPEPPTLLSGPVDDDPGACSVPRGGGWRPGARWARSDRAGVEERIGAMLAHQRPSIRELGRRSEAATHPFRPMRGEDDRSAAAPPAEPALWDRPLVLIESAARRQVVVAACPSARALGLVAGMPATQARVLVPDLDVRPAEPDADMALLRRLTLHAVGRWTPVAAPSGPDGLWLDLSGVAHLHGGEIGFCRKVVDFCARIGLTARIAVADAPGAAHAVARFSARTVAVVPPSGECDAVSPLPIAALRLDAEALAVAARFGLERVADLLPMPRGPLAKRLGLAAVERLDQALGRAAEPITGVEPFEAPRAELRLVEPTGAPEQIARIAADMVADLVERLRERGVGLRAGCLTMRRVDGEERSVTMGTSRPTRDAAHLVRLLGLKLNRIDPGLGVEVAWLVAARVEPLGATEMANALGARDAAGNLATLVDRLAGRVGGRALFRAAPVESYAPERAVRRVGPLAAAGTWPDWRRPARLLARPEPLSSVVALLPDHPPRRFSWRGEVHKVVSGDGPERIVGEWWRRDAEMTAVRDYFVVEDDAGGRFWLFRRGDGVHPATGDLGWWLHGVG